MPIDIELLQKAADKVDDQEGRFFRRELTPKEEEEITEAQNRFFPYHFKSMGDPITADMASPLKTGLRKGLLPYGLLGGAAGGGLGYALGGGKGALIGALLGLPAAGLIPGIIGGEKQEASNRTLEEIMRRNPPGATRRDLISDPAMLALMGQNNLLSSVVAAASAGEKQFGGIPTFRLMKALSMAMPRGR